MSRDSGGRAAFVVGIGIFLSRIAGFVRQLAFNAFFGLTAEADAYNAAFRIPNAVRNLLGEGTLSAAFVPLYSRMLARNDVAASRVLAGAVLGILMLAVSALTLLGILIAPALVSVLASGFDPARHELAVRLTRVLFPMSAVMVLSGWCLGVQNSHRRFFWSYASAVLWSAAQIVLLLGWGKHAASLAQLAYWLAWATLGGALLQVLAQLPEVVRLVGPVRPTLKQSAEGVMPVLRNVIPVTAALGVTQISSFIDISIASNLPVGAVSALSVANLLVQLPVAVFGISVAASSLPDLSRDSGDAAFDVLRERLRNGFLRILFYIVPSAAVFIALGDYCIGILFRAGRFGAPEQTATAWVLAAYAIGLVSFGSVKLMASAYYALQDYRTPLRASMASVALSAVAAASVAFSLRHTGYAAAGIALGAALGSYLNLSLLLRGLRAKLGRLFTPAMWAGTRRIALATAAATVVASLARLAQTALWPNAHPRFAGPPVLAAFGITYLLVAWAMGSGEAARWLRIKPRGNAALR
ncbi:MAG: murein biosynthesis integral membrane protein MurJ [Gemmatimonas sp.]